MSSLKALSHALRAWDAFQDAYRPVKAEQVDFTRERPWFVRDLEERIVEECANQGIECDDPPAMDQWGAHTPEWYSGVCLQCGRSGGDAPNHPPYVDP